MKRIIASAGLLALGIAASKAASAAASTPADKVWGVSTSLRGFYDDNYAESHNNKQQSFGLEFNPRINVNLTGQQTSFGADYSYTMRDFFDRSGGGVDNTHEFGMWMAHQFTELYSVSFRDDLVYSQEPSVTSDGSTIRTQGNVLRNEGQIDFHAQLSRLFGIVTGYRNVLYDYENPSYKALLNRLEHYGNIDFTWQVAPQTVALIGYQFGMIEYSDRATTFIDSQGTPTIGSADTRNSRSHYVYVGMNRHFTPQLTGSLKVGAQFIDYYNLPSRSGLSDNKVSPYVKNSLRYDFLPGSYLEFGVEHQRTQTDLRDTTDGDSTTVYMTLSHSFTPKVIGSITGLAQYTKYDNTDGSTTEDWLYQVGLNLEYRFTRNLSANVAYNFDGLNSDVTDRGYDRNRVFMGATYSY